MPFDIYLYTGHRYLLRTANSSTSLYIFHEIVAVVLFHASLISAAFISGERLYAIFWPTGAFRSSLLFRLLYVVPSQVRFVVGRLLCFLIVGIQASGISIPLSLLMLLG